MSAKLPELPPAANFGPHPDHEFGTSYFTADQMRSYGTACAQAGRVPKEPSPGLLMSMAIRFDHGLGVPGYYDSAPFRRPGQPSHKQRIEATLVVMRQLYEEVSGYGFYKPEFEAAYVERAHGIGGKE